MYFQLSPDPNYRIRSIHVPTTEYNLPKDKYGDTQNTHMYRGIPLFPVIVKLFQYTLLEIYEDQHSSDQLQFGFKNIMDALMHYLLLSR